MELITNELSLHGQFSDISSFLEALGRMMTMRTVAQRYGCVISCKSTLLNRQPLWDLDMRQVLSRIPETQRRAVLLWLARQGPFWDVHRMHPESEWFECRGSVITDTGLGEAAFRKVNGTMCGVVSFSPSEWEDSSIQFVWKMGSDEGEQISGSIANWHTALGLELSLKELAPDVESWAQLRDVSALRFSSLRFSQTCFEGLMGVPFAKRSADHILNLLEVLDRLATGFGDDGRRTPEAQRIYEDHFTGDHAWFSDSSDSEKNRFKDKLTFRDPRQIDRKLIFGWHGKEKHSLIRLHFSWPIRHRESVAIVYIGPKLTKQ